MKPEITLLFYSFTALLTSFILTLLLSPGAIRKLHQMKFGQEVRDDGPQSHLKKQGTPTMGGIIFLIAIAAASLIGFVGRKQADPAALQILLLTMGFGIVGFTDDYLKIKRHQSDGLSPKQKLVLQLLIR